MALGVFSIEWVETSRPVFMIFWSTFVGGNILLGAMIIHVILGMQSLYLRNTLQMSSHDVIQFASALLIMPLLIPHAWGIVGGATLLNYKLTFPLMLQLFWIDTPLEGLRQVLLVVVAWVHACIGLFTWLKLKVWWPRIAPFTYPLAVAIPVLALLGFAEGGNSALELIQAGTVLSIQPADPARQMDSVTFSDNFAFLTTVKWGMLYGYFILVAIVMIARFIRLRAINGMVEIHYQNDDGTSKSIRTKAGASLLEIAIMNDIPHANLCRGRGRCGTCRVLVENSSGAISQPSDIEQATLTRLNCPSGVRLACQLKPKAGSIHIKLLMEPDVETKNLHDATTGEEVLAQ